MNFLLIWEKMITSKILCPSKGLGLEETLPSNQSYNKYHYVMNIPTWAVTYEFSLFAKTCRCHKLHKKSMIIHSPCHNVVGEIFWDKSGQFVTVRDGSKQFKTG